MSDNTENKAGWFKGNRRAIAFIAAGMMVIGSAAGVQAVTQSKTFEHVQLIASDGGWGKHQAGWRHGRGGHFFELSDEEMESRIERMVKHVAIEIDANDDQVRKITRLVTELAREMKPMRDDMRGAGKELHDLLSAETIDREALETLRAARLAKIDEASKNVVEAIADVADVLTAEQRQLLEERIKEFRSMRGRWHRG